MAKVLQSGARAVIRCGSQERLALLDDALWKEPADGWLPHGSVRDGKAEAHPLWLTLEEENPNGASVLVLTESVWPTDPTPDDGAGPLGCGRVLILFDGRDEQAIQSARSRWTEVKAAGATLVYWQQTPAGGWQEKQRVEATL